MNQEPPPAIIQTEEYPKSLSKLMNSRLVKINESIYILNVHFLSIWQLTHEQWTTLFWKLSKYYDEIIIHLGTEEIDYIIEQSKAVFNITSSQFHNMGSSEPENNQICWPPAIEIRRNKAYTKEEKCILEYPLATEALDQSKVQMPYELDKEDKYWSWYDQAVEAIIDPTEAFIIGDYKDNFAGLVAILKSIWKEDERKSKSQKILKT